LRVKCGARLKASGGIVFKLQNVVGGGARVPMLGSPVHKRGKGGGGEICPPKRRWGKKKMQKTVNQRGWEKTPFSEGGGIDGSVVRE